MRIFSSIQGSKSINLNYISNIYSYVSKQKRDEKYRNLVMSIDEFIDRNIMQLLKHILSDCSEFHSISDLKLK